MQEVLVLPQHHNKRRDEWKVMEAAITDCHTYRRVDLHMRRGGIQSQGDYCRVQKMQTGNIPLWRQAWEGLPDFSGGGEGCALKGWRLCRAQPPRCEMQGT